MTLFYLFNVIQQQTTKPWGTRRKFSYMVIITVHILVLKPLNVNIVI